MRGLNLHLANYKAVADANVELSGMTVLAGVNSSGKSTVARLFHAAVQGMRDYDAFAGIAAFETDAGRMLKAVCNYLAEIQVLRPNPLETQFEVVRMPKAEEFWQRVAECKASVLKAIENGLDARILMNLSVRMNRAMTSNDELCDVVGKMFDEVSRFFVSRKSAGVQQTVMSTALRCRAGWVGEDSASLSIADGEAVLFDSDKPSLDGNPLYSLQRSIYIDSPGITEFMSVGDGKLRVGKDEYAANSANLADDKFDSEFFSLVRKMVGGTLVKNNPMSGVQGAWLFNDINRRYAIPLVECAEGIKSVAPLAFLERAGLLAAGTLLVIDEPETHQHPQWIVTYAKLLTWLLENRKMTILLATHSAYLVRALQAAANESGCLDSLNYYLAEPSASGYVFTPQGSDIGGIFRTFNIALREIAFYRE